MARTFKNMFSFAGVYQSHIKIIEVLSVVISDCRSMHALFFERQAITAELGFFLDSNKLEIKPIWYSI